MVGFFSQSEIAKEAKIEVNVEALCSNCGKCKLDKNCRTPRMELSGQGKKRILIIGDTPSDTDDTNAIQFSGESGEYLAAQLKKHGISLNRDCWKVNAIRCHNDVASDKLSAKAKLCSGHIEKIIYEKKPEFVLILGSAGIVSVFPEFKNRNVNRWRGLLIPDEKFDTKFFCTFHPREILINKFDYNLKSVFERDIKNAVSVFQVKRKAREDYNKRVTVVTDFIKVKVLLENVLRKEKLIYFDYETTGLKPYVPGHKIASIGFACSAERGYSFPFEYNDFWTKKELKIIKDLWFRILSSKKIKKVAHSIKFEDMWSAIIIGVRPKSWTWDTMICAHIIDNRKAFVGLKFQTFITWGVRSYDEHIKKYLTTKDGTGFNNVMKAPLKELLLYNGLDCVFGMMLFNKQKSILNSRKGLLNANSFFTNGLITMSSIQLNGIRMDEKYYFKQRQKLMFRIKKLKRQLLKGREAKRFFDHFGRKLNITSNEDLGKLFYEVLGHPAIKTDKGNYKTDKDTLAILNLPFVDKLQNMKRLEKARGTYLSQFAREVFDGVMHPFFDLHIPISYRSSSSMPNFQNLPKRDKEIKNIIRDGIIPRFNHVIGEIDFSGAEVITSVCVTGDTEIETIEGSKTIKQIIKRIKTHDVYVYGYDLNEKRIKIAPVTDGGITGKSKEVWKVTLDNGKEVIATPNHKFMVRTGSKHEGEYIQLKDLKSGMSLMPFYKKKKGDYYYVNLNNRKSIGEHTLIGIDVFKEDVGGSVSSKRVMHHKKGFSNRLSNLQVMLRSDHVSLHHKGKTPGPHSEETKTKISKAQKGISCPQRGYIWSEKQKRKLSDSLKGRLFSDTHKANLSKTKKEYWKNKEDEVCKVCGKSFRKITNTHLLNAHNLTIEEYKKEYNHKVVSVEFYGYEDVYNINVEGIHNYATSAGVILKNCYHKDKNFYNYLMDKTTDMHRDNALDLWMLNRIELENPDFTREQNKRAKDIRFYAKNDWTFAEFYGDWYDSCGRVLWEDCINQQKLILPSCKPLIEHINEQGIYDAEDFVEHCKGVEDKMWNERFPGYTQWKKDIVKFYQKTGYIETFFGFRFQGYMDRKQCTNLPIQGTSFHLLVYTLIEVEKFIKRHKLKTRIIGQIHDSLISDIYLPELQFYLQGVNRIVEGLKDRFKWLIVPMEIEAEITLPEFAGGTFSTMYEVTPSNIVSLNIADVYKDAIKGNNISAKEMRITEALLKKAA